MFLGDNMEFMKDVPDKHYDLAIVDPPYGINLAKSTGVLSRYNTQGADWDKAVPGKEYFDELFRVSKNQIIWGGELFRLATNTRVHILVEASANQGLLRGRICLDELHKESEVLRLSVFGVFKSGYDKNPPNTEARKTLRMVAYELRTKGLQDT